MWCRFCRCVECKNYRITVASTQTSKETLGGFPEWGEVWQGQDLDRQIPRGQCMKQWWWSLSCNRDPRKLEMPGVWNVCQGKRQDSEQNQPQREAMRAIGSRATEAGLPKPLGAHIMTPCDLDAEYGAMEFSVCPAGFQDCFGPILSCYSLFYSTLLYLGKVYISFGFCKISQLRDCLATQKRLWIWTFEPCWNCQDFRTLGDRLSAFCIMRWGPGVGCYSLNIKCPLQTHVLEAWFPAGGVILGGSGNFRRWSLVRGSRSLGAWLWRLYLVSSLLLTYFASYFLPPHIPTTVIFCLTMGPEIGG
jgi:hypothetical protein